MEIDKLFENNSIDNVADNVFGVVNNSVSEVREMQRKKVAENVQLVVNALKKIEEDIREKYDAVSGNLEKRIISIKDGRDGINGRDGKDGKDGKQGKDGRPGRDGKDGKNGLNGADGQDGVSVVNAHIDFDGSLIISLSSGKEINVGEVVAPALAEQIKVITNGGGTSQSVLDTLTSLQSQIDAIGEAVVYKGLWNASTNSPTITSGVGTSGNFYIVSVAGSTNLDGITNWKEGDWAVFNGVAWQRVEGGADGNFTTVTASSLTSGRVTYAGTGGLLQDSSNLTFNGTTLTSAGFSGPLNGTVGATTPSTGAFTTLNATGVATFSAGSDAAPAITTSGDTNTGIFFPAADTIAFTEGGAEAMRINSAGNVGIGTTNPATPLHVIAANNEIARWQTNDSATGNLWHGFYNNAGTRKGYLAYAGAGDDFFIHNDANAAILFDTNNSERMRIDSSGNVGIGTSSPGAKLHVEGSVDASVISQTVNTSTGTSAFAQTTVVGNDTTLRLIAYGSNHVARGNTAWLNVNEASRSLVLATGNTERARITSSGVFYLGPLATNFSFTNGSAVDLSGSGTGLAGNGTNLTLGVWNGPIVFQAGNSGGALVERARIDSSGNVGIGMTPSSGWRSVDRVLQIQSSGVIRGQTNANLIDLGSNYYINNSNLSVYIASDYASRFTQYQGVFSWESAASGTAGNTITWTERMRIDSSGNLLVGTTSDSTTSGVGTKIKAQTIYTVVDTSGAQNQFHFYNANATNNGFRFYVGVDGGISNYSGNNVNLSDERKKTNIEIAGNYLEKICAIPVKLFNYKDEAEGEQRTLGVIAQDVEIVAPELVDQDGWLGDAPEGESPLKSIYTTDMMFAFMRCIQELKAENDVLKARLDAAGL